MKNTFRVRDDQGKWMDIDTSRIKQNPIRHDGLPDAVLARIKAVYDQFRGIIPMTLEQFELGFMRDEEPLKEVGVWETIALCSTKAMATMENTFENRRQTYQNIVELLLGSISDEQLDTKEIRTLKRLFSEAHYELKQAA